ncbi:MAG: glutamyl-tRNA reductase [Planctomycetes bacterium]|nr:glutamyl-tRNA reductase [Planctomycetota bacterium]
MTAGPSPRDTLLVVGVNHRVAPIEERELIAFRPEDLPGALGLLRERYSVRECVIVSTCNRVELYLGATELDDPVARELLLAWHREMARSLGERAYLYRGGEAARHLFEVAAGLDSMVVGETEVLGQIKDAYGLATAQGFVGPLLHSVFQRAFQVARTVRTRTGLSEGRVSVPGVAVAFARRIFEDLREKVVLVVGGGRMGRLTLENLIAEGVRSVLVANRTRERAEALAREVGGTAVPFDGMDPFLPLADIIICSTASPKPVLCGDRMRGVARQRRHRPVLILDIAVPRDVEPAVGEMDGVFLYDIDDLEEVAAENMEHRSELLEAGRELVRQELERFQAERVARDADPAIVALRERLHQLRAAELERVLRTLPGLDPQQRVAIEDMTVRLVNKILHRPMEVLREEAASGDGAPLAAALQQLFAGDHPEAPMAGEPRPPAMDRTPVRGQAGEGEAGGGD